MINQLKLCQIDQKAKKIKDFLDEASNVIHAIRQDETHF
jgi:hypothetical protein